MISPRAQAQLQDPPWAPRRFRSDGEVYPARPVEREAQNRSPRGSLSPRDGNGAGDAFGLETLCGACCSSRPKGLKVKRLRPLEYAALLEALDVDDGAPDPIVCLPPFLARFPHKLHPLLRPIFFYLGRGGELMDMEAAVHFPVFADTLSRITHGSGCRWKDLMDAFMNFAVGSSVEQAVQHAGCLCFFFAYPYLAHSPDDVLTGTSVSKHHESAWTCNDSWEQTPHGSVTSSRGASFCESDRMKVDTLLTSLANPKPASDSPRKRLSSSLAATYDCSSLEAAVAWLEAAVPCLPLAFGPQLSTTLMGSIVPANSPLVDSNILDAGQAFLLRGTSSELWESEAWTSLFDAGRDGRSFAGLLHSVQHYRGPIAIIIQTTNGEVLGAVSRYWEDGQGDFGGGPDCYIFAISPSLVVCRACGESNFCYVNRGNRMKARGLGFGGKLGQDRDWFRFYINDSLNEGYVLQGDMTYQRAALLPGDEFETNFKIAKIELWGCGVYGAAKEQTEQKKRVQSMSERGRQVDKTKLIRSQKDADLFLPNTFKATGSAREVTGVLDRDTLRRQATA